MYLDPLSRSYAPTAWIWVLPWGPEHLNGTVPSSTQSLTHSLQVFVEFSWTMF